MSLCKVSHFLTSSTDVPWDVLKGFLSLYSWNNSWSYLIPEMSLIERYMSTCDVYKRRDDDTYDTRLLTKLVCNYRSHPAILELPNSCFYDDELKPFADTLLRESLCGWEWLPKQGFPLIFHGVVGQDMREETSPSFFNPTEVSIVMDYVTKLLDTKRNKVKETDIGIISPYRKQVGTLC